MGFLVATTSLPAVYCPNGYARTTTAETPHGRAKKPKSSNKASSDPNFDIKDFLRKKKAERDAIFNVKIVVKLPKIYNTVVATMPGRRIYQ